MRSYIRNPCQNSPEFTLDWCAEREHEPKLHLRSLAPQTICKNGNHIQEPTATFQTLCTFHQIHEKCDFLHKVTVPKSDKESLPTF